MRTGAEVRRAADPLGPISRVQASSCLRQDGGLHDRPVVHDQFVVEANGVEPVRRGDHIPHAILVSARLILVSVPAIDLEIRRSPTMKSTRPLPAPPLGFAGRVRGEGSGTGSDSSRSRRRCGRVDEPAGRLGEPLATPALSRRERSHMQRRLERREERLIAEASADLQQRIYEQTPPAATTRARSNAARTRSGRAGVRACEAEAACTVSSRGSTQSPFRRATETQPAHRHAAARLRRPRE